MKQLLRQTINLTTNVNTTSLTILTANGMGLQAGFLHLKTSSSAKLTGKLSKFYKHVPSVKNSVNEASFDQLVELIFQMK